MSYRHPLTALPSHTLFSVHLQAAVEQAALERCGLVVFTIGIQRLDNILRNSNRETVNEVLEYLAHVIQRTVRHSDVVGHEADHCFFVLIKNVREHRVDKVGQELGARLLNLLSGPIPTSSGDCQHVGVSIGMAVFPHDAQTASELLLLCTETANHAKKEEKHRFLASSDRLSIKRNC
ncbi:MAG: diguanylate cyclase [Pseudomonadota bacterium]